jgi:hypothetical protein
MWFYIPAIILIVLFALWFRRTSIYRHHRAGQGRDPGDSGTRMEGRFGDLGGSFNRPERRP